MRRPLLILASAVWCSCASPPPASGSLRVQVNVEPGLDSLCARLVARGRVERESSPVMLSGRTSFVVGISQEDDSSEVLLQAQGYADEGCTTLMVPPENSELLAARYGSPTPAVMLTLRFRQARDGGVDGDGDGFFSGQDCDDTNAAVHPGAEESCLNAVDDDCDEAIDCADPTCAARACGVNGQCSSTGGCVAPSEAGLCADGLDNDADGRLDCADSDCPSGSACNDTNACTRNDSCGASGCAGSAVSCTQPPAQCFASTGRCVPEAGGACVYDVVSGPCNDGLSCTQNDVCGADGTCAGTQRSCTTPPGACAQAAGQCSESQGGTCVYPPRTGACDDADNCTVGDACSTSGVCSGTRVTCTPPGECFTANGCSANGGCLFSARSGGCDGGTCDGAGTCVPSVVEAFPFTPSNFSPAQLPASGGAVVVSCDVTIDTSSGGLGWTTCPGGPAAPPWSLAGSAVLLFFDSFTINGGATVRAIGDRPLIIAVRGDVTISGTLTASSEGVRGAGSEVACTSGVGGNGGASGNPQTAGGGGGGGFRNNGGRGSDGDHGGSDGDRGDENGNENLTPLRGGCRGGNGGRTDQSAGLGGRGGGALQLSVGGGLTIEWGGTLSAQGEGGHGGQGLQRIGGGGGGSGGALFLEAARLTLNAGAAVVANGGAGGEGSGLISGGDGQSGQRGTQRALAFSLTCGGNGGNGGARAGGATNAHEPECGSDFAGGGGGGSAGRIRFNAHDACSLSGAAVISPEPHASGNCR